MYVGACTRTHRHTIKYVRTNTQTPRTDRHTDIHTDTQKHTHTHTHTNTHTHTHTHTYTEKLTIVPGMQGSAICRVAGLTKQVPSSSVM